MNKNHRLWFLSAIVVCAMVLLVSGCGQVYKSDQGGSSVPPPTTPTVDPGAAAAPVFSPFPGTYEAFPLLVTIECSTGGAFIYYTTDGSIPLPASPSTYLYRSPVELNSPTILKAIAVKQGLSDSAIVEAVYTVQDNVLPVIEIQINSKEASTVTPEVSLWLSAQDNIMLTGIYVSSESSGPRSSADWFPIFPAREISGSLHDFDININMDMISDLENLKTIGPKTVYAWARDLSGNVSAMASDSIMLEGWTRQFGTDNNNSEVVTSVAVYSYGNTEKYVCVAGYTKGDLDADHPGNSSEDAFVRVYAPDGTVLWTDQFGDPAQNDRANGIAVANNEQVYVTGYFGTASAGKNAFVRRYYANSSSLMQETTISTTADDVGNGIAIANDGHVYVTGFTKGDLDSQHGGNSKEDIFVAKFNGLNLPSPLWTKQYGTTANDAGKGIAVDNSSVYVTGYTAGNLQPGAVNPGGNDLFVMRCDPQAGDSLSVKQSQGSGLDAGTGIALNDSNVYVVGYYYLPGNIDTNVLVQKYSLDLTVEQWTEKFGTAFSDIGYGVVADNSNVYVTGYTYGEFIGSGGFSGDMDVFARKYTLDGSEVWTKQFGTSTDDVGSGIALDRHGNIYAAGYTKGDLDGEHSGNATEDGFLVKRGPNGEIDQ